MITPWNLYISNKLDYQSKNLSIIPFQFQIHSILIPFSCSSCFNKIDFSLTHQLCFFLISIGILIIQIFNYNQLYSMTLNIFIFYYLLFEIIFLVK
jgi:hypothetical protein